MNSFHKYFALKPYEKTSFEKSLENVSADLSEPLLPLIHKVDCTESPEANKLTAAEYFALGRIEPVPCDVFGENLVYTYIGRPSYRELSLPACFIIRPEPELLQNIFVFDSGAYYENRYGKVVDNMLDVNLFRIPATTDMIRRFIARKFGDNTYYYFGLSKNAGNYELMDSLEEFDYSILENVIRFDKTNFDTRCRTLENILRTPISLKEYMMAVILPKSRKDNEEFRTFCEEVESDFDILFYDDGDLGLDSQKCNRRLDKVLLQYYLDKGYISL